MQLSHQGDGQHIFKLEKAMRLSEDIIRYLTVKQDGPIPTPRSSNKNSDTTEKAEINEIDVKNATGDSSTNEDSKPNPEASSSENDKSSTKESD